MPTYLEKSGNMGCPSIVHYILLHQQFDVFQHLQQDLVDICPSLPLPLGGQHLCDDQHVLEVDGDLLLGHDHLPSWCRDLRLERGWDACDAKTGQLGTQGHHPGHQYWERGTSNIYEVWLMDLTKLRGVVVTWQSLQEMFSVRVGGSGQEEQAGEAAELGGHVVSFLRSSAAPWQVPLRTEREKSTLKTLDVLLRVFVVLLLVAWRSDMGHHIEYRIGVINKPTIPDQVGHKLCHREVGSLVHVVEGPSMKVFLSRAEAKLPKAYDVCG